MTDREAIRRLATIVSELAYATGHQNFTDQAIEVIEVFARDDPAAPTDWTQTEEYKARCKASGSPTVTREQAEWMAKACEVWFNLNQLRPPTPEAQPAFFRAVADALEGE